MATSLTGLTPSTTYDALIKVGDNGPIDGTLKTLSDGLGNDLPMEASTTAINFTGTLTQAGTTLQPTLVSGTNIKTINSTSLLGSGDIAVVTSPSGVAGAIQFSDGSAFASDATNLFWDDTNNRLGVGTNAPTATAHFKGSGSTSATTSLLVQNSAGSSALQVQDNLICNFGGNLTVISGGTIGVSNGSRSITFDSTGATNLYTAFGGHIFSTYNQSSYIDFVTITGNTTTPSLLVGVGTVNNSAIVNLTSTTQGFLPPRMTTTQKNAISSPAAGLVVYDNTTNKLCCYNGSTWNDLF